MTFRNRDVWLRLGLVLTGLLLLLSAMQAWRSPFPYRLGQRVAHGLLAKVDFQQPDRHRTDLARDEAEAAVIPIFRHDPAPLEKLLQRLRSHLSDIANAARVDDVPVATRAAFGLTTAEQPQQSDSPNMDMHTEFSTLKALVAREDGVEGNRIDQLIAEFRQFIEPIRRYGLADPDTFTRYDLRTDSSIAVIREGDESSREVVLPTDVQLKELLGKTGLLGKSWQEFPELQQPALQKYLSRWLLAQDPTTLVYDADATQRAKRLARENTEPVFDEYLRGDVLLPPGQVIDDDRLAVLQAEYDRMEEMAEPGERVVRMLTVFLLLTVLAVLNARYLVTHERRLVTNAVRLAVFLGAIVITVTLGRILSFDPWRAEVIPLSATVMIFAIAYNQVLAMLMALSLCLVLTISTQANLPLFIVLLSVSATCVTLLSQVPSRMTLIKVGFWAGVVYFLMSMGIGIFSRQTFTQAWADPYLLEASIRGAAWCLASGYLVAGSLPFVESAFGVVTDISLLEMSDVSHPLLQELVRRAPGTYNHSMTVASIGESAADAIGANGLLVRVGAYFHDVGKMLKPHYFIENVHKGDESRHNRLNPAMSTLIIIGHVKDGVDLAKQHNLPRQLIDFIEQHHGTTLVEYFYNAAKGKADEQPGHRTDAEESLFRYPGPKPQTKEAGVLMIADAVESASRTLSEPTPASIENLVTKITMKKLLDGQFDESTLNLTEIHTVEASLIKSLIGIYHGRIKYPEQQRSVSA